MKKLIVRVLSATLAGGAPMLAACATGDSVEEGGSTATSQSGGEDVDGGSPTNIECSASIDLQTDPQNCGTCGRTCVLPNGTAACVAGECALGSCDLGFADCDGAADTGCEHPIACVQGDSCMSACGSIGGLSCADVCTPTCNAPAELCNAIDDDCDGACDQGAVAGCRVGIHRAYNGTQGHLFTPSLAEAQGWGLEFENFYYLYNDAAADLRPFFRCSLGGFTFYTESNDCELTGAPLATIGFIAPRPAEGMPGTCGSVPLYRMSNSANGWHFYTVSAPERDSAVASGWTDEGVAGYVWTTP